MSSVVPGSSPLMDNNMIGQYANAPEEMAQRIDELNEAQKISLMAELARGRNQDYTTEGKTNEDIYYDDEGRPVYPPKDGSKGEWTPTTLQPGDTLVDRYGPERGFFLSPEGTSFEERSLPRGQRNAEYHKYRVKKPFFVDESVALPRFGQPGGGKQYRTHAPIRTLKPDYLEEVFE